MRYIVRKPDFIVEIVRPDYSAGIYKTVPPVIRFVSSSITRESDTEIISNDLISYQFSETLATVNTGFSLELVPRIDKKGKNWLEKIQMYDLVFIYEFGELRYGGYVNSLRYAARMGSDGKPNRKIRISGGGFGELLSTIQLVLEQALYQASTTAEAASTRLSGILASQLDEENNDIGSLFQTIYNAFMELVMAVGLEGVNIGIKPILDHFLDFDSGISKNLKAKYPMVLSLYRVGENNVWQILSELLFPPANELFGRWKSEKVEYARAKSKESKNAEYERAKYEIVFRQAPFEPEDWKRLPSVEIPSIMLINHDIGRSNAEIFTFYLGELPGAGISRNLALLMGSGPRDVCYVVDQKKWSKYGFRPMYVQFKYFNVDYIDTFGAAALMRQVSEMLKRWFEHNDEFYSGSLTLMTTDNKNIMKRNPRIGEKIRFLGGEFYLESSDHSWEYGGPMVTKLTITRGYKYDASGKMEGPMDQVSRRLEAISQEI